MPGWNKNPGNALPKNWGRLRRAALRRDRGVCYICGQPGADTVDHVLPRWKGGTDDLDNLGSAHETPCHKRKSQKESGERRRELHALRSRPTQRHPGMSGA